MNNERRLLMTTPFPLGVRQTAFRRGSRLCAAANFTLSEMVTSQSRAYSQSSQTCVGLGDALLDDVQASGAELAAGSGEREGIVC
jgi:hypothetical protein